MTAATDGRHGLADADVSPENIERIEAVIPDAVRSAAIDISGEARALAWLSFELLRRFREVNATVHVLTGADSFNNGGDLTNAVEAALGLDVATEVFDGLAVAFGEYFEDMRREDAAATAARHGRDHYCEVGEPCVTSNPNSWTRGKPAA